MAKGSLGWKGEEDEIKEGFLEVDASGPSLRGRGPRQRGGVKVFPGSGLDRRARKPHLHLDNPAPPWKLEGLGHTLALRVNPQQARSLTLRNVQTLRVGGGVGYVTTPHSPGALGSRNKPSEGHTGKCRAQWLCFL